MASHFNIDANLKFSNIKNKLVDEMALRSSTEPVRKAILMHVSKITNDAENDKVMVPKWLF
jgi:hypothetical protein